MKLCLFEPDSEEEYQQQAMDLVDDRKRAEERNSNQQNETSENNNGIKDTDENSEKLSSLVEEAFALQELVEEGNMQRKPDESGAAVEENIQVATESIEPPVERIPDVAKCYSTKCYGFREGGGKSFSLGAKQNPGDDLSSQTFCSVFSALVVLTSLFGMGRGVALPQSSPGFCPQMHIWISKNFSNTSN